MTFIFSPYAVMISRFALPFFPPEYPPLTKPRDSIPRNELRFPDFCFSPKLFPPGLIGACILGVVWQTKEKKFFSSTWSHGTALSELFSILFPLLVFFFPSLALPFLPLRCLPILCWQQAIPLEKKNDNLISNQERLVVVQSLWPGGEIAHEEGRLMVTTMVIMEMRLRLVFDGFRVLLTACGSVGAIGLPRCTYIPCSWGGILVFDDHN